ncbi:MAG: SUMF1/EgtB/PvdO family nonheme iron enzyme [Planctomycetota bacterium]|nr:SUMF1/EgtB/PvdO family nonheme iron enzyme [Planctomycetota bacterium]
MKKARLTILALACLAVEFAAVAIAADVPSLAKSPFNRKQARESQQQWAKQIGKELVYTNSIGMKLALLPPGEFTMGRTEEQLDELLKVIDADPEMKKNRGGQITWSMLMMPAHRVRLTKPFYMGTTEVTVAQFRAFAEASGYQTEAEQGLNAGVPYKGGRPISTWRKPMAWRTNYTQADDEPVIHLCWNDCVAFCEWLSEKEGVQYGLPTEAEWEYACRAGTATPWSFGGYEDAERLGRQHAVWSDTVQKFDVPQRVAQRQPNAFGLYDMHGNMWEYVADWWHRYSYKESPLNDPTGPAVQSEKNDQRRIIRGSSFDWGRWGGDSAYRMRITQRSNQHPHMSFRVAMRIKDVQGVPAAVDLDEERRQKPRDPGADSPEVVAALKAGTEQVPSGGEKLPKELAIELSDGAKMQFVLIPAGSFAMGSADGDRDERPRHRVVISKPFYMARHEVTQSQWEALMGKHPYLAELTAGGDHEMSGPTKAMNMLSWNDCQKFVAALQEKVAVSLRKTKPHRAGRDGYFALPTEAQWEYACRAGSTTEFHFGKDESQLGEYAFYQGNMNWPGQPGFRGKAFYHDVAQKKPNAFGLYDMHGGVWEWCADRYDADYYFDSPLVDPTGPAQGRFRVLRGGSWFRYAKYARSSYRKFFHPESDGDGVTAYINDFGCRVAINLPATEKTQP